MILSGCIVFVLISFAKMLTNNKLKCFYLILNVQIICTKYYVKIIFIIMGICHVSVVTKKYENNTNS